MGLHRLLEAPRELPFQDTPGSRGQGLPGPLVPLVPPSTQCT